jgi:hypothetical protein
MLALFPDQQQTHIRYTRTKGRTVSAHSLLFMFSAVYKKKINACLQAKDNEKTTYTENPQSRVGLNTNFEIKGF